MKVQAVFMFACSVGMLAIAIWAFTVDADYVLKVVASVCIAASVAYSWVAVEFWRYR